MLFACIKDHHTPSFTQHSKLFKNKNLFVHNCVHFYHQPLSPPLDDVMLMHVSPATRSTDGSICRPGYTTENAGYLIIVVALSGPLGVSVWSRRRGCGGWTWRKSWVWWCYMVSRLSTMNGGGYSLLEVFISFYERWLQHLNECDSLGM